MSGFRKNFSCEHVLTNFIESAKRALDDQTYVGSVMTDLSRAFDCLPPRLLLCKFHAYGVAEGSCILLSSYFVNRTQRVKIGNYRSQIIYKGAAQGSIMGPFCFNVLCIDLFFLIADNIRIFNYADDTTIMSCDINVHTVIENLENTANVIIDKTSRHVNALCRLRNVASKESKCIMFKTYTFNYCSTIWHYCGNISTIKIEKLNKRALRIVFNDNTSTYNELLSMSKH